MIVSLATQGRFGNQMFQYAYARAYAEKYGHELQTDDWVGRRIFQLNEPICERKLPRRSELTVEEGEGDIEFYAYFQSQKAMIYTQEQVRKWFVFRQDVLWVLDMALNHHLADFETVAHLRRGDYFGYKYVVVSEASYERACAKFGLPMPITKLSEETAIKALPWLSSDLLFLFDFYRMMNAPYLLRANSSFSWWAATLGLGRVFSPVIDGLEGGKEHDCEFVEGNWPRFANLDFVTDLHLPA